MGDKDKSAKKEKKPKTPKAEAPTSPGSEEEARARPPGTLAVIAKPLADPKLAKKARLLTGLECGRCRQLYAPGAAAPVQRWQLCCWSSQAPQAAQWPTRLASPRLCTGNEAGKEGSQAQDGQARREGSDQGHPQGRQGVSACGAAWLLARPGPPTLLRHRPPAVGRQRVWFCTIPAPSVCVIAGDISPIDVITPLPVLCEDADVPYIYVPSKDELGQVRTGSACSRGGWACVDPGCCTGSSRSSRDDEPHERARQAPATAQGWLSSLDAP